MRSASKQRKGTKRKAWTEQAILDALRESLSHDFPNPKRIGCPALEALERNAKDPIHADESVSSHIAQCSPCYRSYSRLLGKELARMRKEAASSAAKLQSKRSSPKKH